MTFVASAGPGLVIVMRYRGVGIVMWLNHLTNASARV